MLENSEIVDHTERVKNEYEEIKKRINMVSEFKIDEKLIAYLSRFLCCHIVSLVAR